MSPRFPLCRERRPAAMAVFLLSLLSCLRPSIGAERATLLFHLDGGQGLKPSVCAPGTDAPNFAGGITAISDGAHGAALSCANDQVLAYEAPGNIYAQRGTLAFFWRARYPVGPTEFPLFRVGYADHSSWDMVWLRIDYNGHGFDAFVTDASLARLRVSAVVEPFPAPERWIHLALAWDEARGIRFFVDGRLMAEERARARLDTGLDQFGPHSRIISPYQVQSDYNFRRGGDIDEVRIYDRMLSDEAVAALATGSAEAEVGPLAAVEIGPEARRAAWMFRHGWNREGDRAPLLERGVTCVRKVEIHEAYDLKRWWWKANDGIRETTWPGVYNRSRLPGRHDYFVLPDWDCYSLSGRSVSFHLPEEPWNQLEISGAAFGRAEWRSEAGAPPRELFSRPQGQERTWHRLERPVSGGEVIFTNEEQETPIGEFAALSVKEGKEPAGVGKLTYRLSANAGSNPELDELQRHIKGRHPAGERQMLVALPESLWRRNARGRAREVGSQESAMPLVHVLIPFDFREAGLSARGISYTWRGIDAGLDGIAIDLPGFDASLASRGVIQFNLQVRDPLWPSRAMLDFSFSVPPGSPRTLWLDLRDRMLPDHRSLYLTLASDALAFGAEALDGAGLRLVFKERKQAMAEHVIDRFTQARDSYAMLVEEHPNTRKYRLFARYEADLHDLLRVDPGHAPGRYYWALTNPEQPAPFLAVPEAPPGVPEWAFLQAELLRRLESFVSWYIDNRQIENGELGGGLSDDTDICNHWPATALMGCSPDKIADSLRRVLEACYAQGMFTNGLPTIQTDELHTYEEGINALGQLLLLDHGNPRQLERAMETMRGLEEVTGVNAAGHRHIRSSYYSGSKMAVEEPWGWQKTYSFLVLHPGYMLVEYNGSPVARSLITELADGLLAHRKVDPGGRGSIPSAIRFADDAEGTYTRGDVLWEPFWAGWKWTGDDRFLAPIEDGGAQSLFRVNANALDLLGRRDDWGAAIARAVAGEADSFAPVSRYRSNADRQVAWQMSGDRSLLAAIYREQIANAVLNDYRNTLGSLWIDRVTLPYAELQRARLGGIALVRNSIFPGNTVSWRFDPPASGTSVGILIPDATPRRFSVIVHNLEKQAVRGTMTGWNVDPGVWSVEEGEDRNDDGAIDAVTRTRSISFGRSESVGFIFPPGQTTALRLVLKEPGKAYWERPDVGLGAGDVVVESHRMRVRVHSLGGVPTPGGRVLIKASDGSRLGEARFQGLEAPADLQPRTVEVVVPLSEGVELAGASVVLELDGDPEEVSRMNNVASLPKP